MRRSLHKETALDATVDLAWTILAGFPAYAEWNPVIARAEGRADFGQSLALEIRLPGFAPHRLQARLLRVHPPREMLWIARSGFPGLLDIEYRALLEPVIGGGSRLQQELQVGGMLTLFVWRRIEAAADTALDRLGHAFAQRCRDGATETVFNYTGAAE